MPWVITTICSVLQDIIFRQIGNTWKAGSFKHLMNTAFIIFEKIAVHFDILTEVYINAYEEVIDAELSMLNLRDTDRVIVIGSGAIPVTAILITRKSKVRVTTIDIDPEAVARATLLIHRLGLQQQINVMLADGFSYPLHAFTVIFLLYGISHQERLLKAMIPKIDTGVKIITRSTTDDPKRIVDGAQNIFNKLELVNHLHTTSLGAVDSFLMIKKP
ncbi:MAG: hypothetical protein KKG04_02205 [Candidatus Thermoplasmatota archaeon]|nr:hypothetical protein [Candidatus Thermoplasmatota archaeon]